MRSLIVAHRSLLREPDDEKLVWEGEERQTGNVCGKCEDFDKTDAQKRNLGIATEISVSKSSKYPEGLSSGKVNRVQIKSGGKCPGQAKVESARMRKGK